MSPRWPWQRHNDELAEELESHFRMALADRLARGEDRAAAERAVRRQFGNRARVAEVTRSMWRGAAIEAAVRPVRFAVRRLARTPIFAAACLATLAVGIGATVAIFAVVNSILLRPLPYPEADRLVSILYTAPGLGMAEVPQSDASFFLYHDEARAFAGIAAWSQQPVNLAGDGTPERVDGLVVSREFFEVLQVRMELGRPFTDADNERGAPLTVVISNGLWHRRYGGAATVIGQTIRIDGTAAEIIGVAPAVVRIGGEPELFQPARLSRATANSGAVRYSVLGRLAPEATQATALADLARVLPQLPERYPGFPKAMFEQARFAPIVRPLKGEVVGDIGTVLWILLGSVGVVLVIACVNVGNLFMVRAEGRHREMAIRAALGAGQAQVAVHQLIEALVLAFVGGAIGLLLAWGGLRWVVALGPAMLPRLHEIGLDGWSVLLAVTIALLAGLGFGSLSALLPGFRPKFASLREGARGASAGRERHRVRNALVVLQMALALVLLVSSGLLWRTYQGLRAVNPGFSGPESVVTLRVSLVGEQFPDPAAVARADGTIRDRLRLVPGVAAVGAASELPLEGSRNVKMFVSVEDFPVAAGTLPPTFPVRWISGDYFKALGVPVAAGRVLDQGDDDMRARRAVVNETFARQHWKSAGEALGKRIGIRGGLWEIVGVVGDVREGGLDQDPVATAFFPTVGPDATPATRDSLYATPGLTLLVRATEGGGSALAPAVIRAVHEIYPDLPVSRVRSMDDIAQSSMARASFAMVMLALAAGVALFLGAVGLYGVISYVVAERTREIGVRMALGAEQGAISWMVLRQGFGLAILGIGVGAVAARAVTGLLTSLLHGVGPLDRVTFGTVAFALLAVALVASWLPARRAAKVDPTVALNAE